MRKFLQGVIVVSFLGMSSLFSQSLSKADSLINTLTEDDFVSKEMRLKNLKELIFIYQSNSHEKSLEYGKMALELSQKIKDENSEIEMLKVLAFINNQLCSYSETDKIIKGFE